MAGPPGPINFATPPTSGPSPLMGLLAGLAQIPAAIQARKEHQQDRQMQQEQQQTLLETAKANLGQKFRENVIQETSGDPTLRSNSAYVTSTIAKFKHLGMDVPLKDGPNGEKIIDTDAWAPSKDVSRLTAQERLAILQAEPGPQRDAMLVGFTGKPEEMAAMRTAPAYRAMTSGEAQGLQKNIAQMEEKVGAGTLNPKAVVNFVTANRGRLEQAGINVDTYLSPEYLDTKIGAIAQSKIDQGKALGIHYQNEDAARLIIANEKKREFGITSAIRQENADTNRMNAGTRAQAVSAQVMQRQQQISINAANLQVRRAELDQKERTLDNAAQGLTLKQNAFTTKVFNDAAKSFETAYDKAQSEFDGLIKNINSAKANNSSYEPDDQTKDRLTELRKKLDELGPKVQAARQISSQNDTRAISTVLGKPVTKTNASPYAVGAKNPEDPNYTFTGNAKDGWYEVKGRDGKTRWWKPKS